MFFIFQNVVLVVFIGLGMILGILGLIAAFWYAKDIFTPTRKSVLISGVFMTLAGFSCLLPIVVMSRDFRLTFTLVDIYNAIVQLTCVVGFVLFLVAAYVIPTYLYAISREKKK